MIGNKLFKQLLLPWHTTFLPVPRFVPRVFLGFFPKKAGGPDLKITKLREDLGINWFNHNTLYIVSGKPLPLPYVRMSKKRGCKIILNQNGVYYPAWFHGDCEKENGRLRKYHELADYVFYQSHFCFETTRQFVHPPERPHEILYNAVDTDHFTPADKKTLGKPLRLMTTSYFNHFTAEPILNTLMRTLAALKEKGLESQLYIAGEIHEDCRSGSSAQQWLGKMAKNIGVENAIHYMGPYTTSELPDLLRQSDIFIHLRHNDACPNGILEAMACGLPVVFSQSGGTPELVGDAGIGLDVPQSFERWYLPEPNKVAQAVYSIITHYDQLRHQARERADNHFSMVMWQQRQREIMQHLINNGGFNI
ncbi:MAG: glycosyltransferase family 4 protein [Elusimicrobia bacterium]|nr:glycosyltransferase family 4 protein [Candidatus Obscuribacterium magneticum]